MDLDLNKLARQAGFTQLPGYSFVGHAQTPDAIKRFADLVAAAEREACEKACEAYWKSLEEVGEDDYQTGRARAAVDLQNAINARNEPPKGRD